MSGFEIIILIGLIVVIATGVGYYMNYGEPTLKEMKEDFNKNEKVKELVELAQELYNKDLRPIVAKKAPEKEKFQPRKITIQSSTSQVNKAVKETINTTEPKVKKDKQEKSEFPIDKPKKKRKYYPKKK
jgi:preprotein translocase subunit SecF